jgi:hypothetical protein
MKGQILSVDLMFAVLIILIIISALTYVLTQYAVFEMQQQQNTDIEVKIQAAASSLLLGTGNPPTWQTQVGNGS